MPQRVSLSAVSQAMLSDQPKSTSALPAIWDAPEWPADDESAELNRKRQRAVRSGAVAALPDATPSTANALRARHRDVLVVSLTAVVMAFVLVEVPGGRVAVRGLTGYPLPPSCFTRTAFGLKCPGCGLTRSFIHLAEGDWRPC
jgi:Protein of unknown function (DUF2752)